MLASKEENPELKMPGSIRKVEVALPMSFHEQKEQCETVAVETRGLLLTGENVTTIEPSPFNILSSKYASTISQPSHTILEADSPAKQSIAHLSLLSKVKTKWGVRCGSPRR